MNADAMAPRIPPLAPVTTAICFLEVRHNEEISILWDYPTDAERYKLRGSVELEEVGPFVMLILRSGDRDVAQDTAPIVTDMRSHIPNPLGLLDHAVDP